MAINNNYPIAEPVGEIIGFDTEKNEITFTGTVAMRKPIGSWSFNQPVHGTETITINNNPAIKTSSFTKFTNASFAGKPAMYYESPAGHWNLQSALYITANLGVGGNGSILNGIINSTGLIIHGEVEESEIEIPWLTLSEASVIKDSIIKVTGGTGNTKITSMNIKGTTTIEDSLFYLSGHAGDKNRVEVNCCTIKNTKCNLIDGKLLTISDSNLAQSVVEIRDKTSIENFNIPNGSYAGPIIFHKAKVKNVEVQNFKAMAIYGSAEIRNCEIDYCNVRNYGGFPWFTTYFDTFKGSILINCKGDYTLDNVTLRMFKTTCSSAVVTIIDVEEPLLDIVIGGSSWTTVTIVGCSFDVTEFTQITFESKVNLTDEVINQALLESLGYTVTITGDSAMVTGGNAGNATAGLKLPLGITVGALEAEWVETVDGSPLRNILAKPYEYDSLFSSIGFGSTVTIGLEYKEQNQGGTEDVDKPTCE